MNLSTNSWHYRLHKFRTTDTYQELRNHNRWPKDYPAVSLCWYFWATVGTMITTVFLGIGSILIGGAILAWFLNGLTVFVLALFNVFPEFLNYDFALWSWLGGMSAIIGATLFSSVVATVKGEMKFAPDYLTKYFPKKGDTCEKVIPKQLGLVGEYIKAKKSKWCPLVEVVDYE